ncbi:hypothetical protein G9A89_020155, partial [Geosiphon pyriformis]
LETGNTTKSNSINMEKKCLIEETSFNYGESSAIAGDSDQISTGSKVKTKKTLGKPLGKINFSLNDNENNILLDASLELPPPLKNLVNISVYKSFTLNIGLNKVVGKSFQKKLQVVRKLFSKINGFGEASTSSKFAGIIKAMFISESSLVQTSKKAEKVKILVNSDLKKSSGHSDQTVVLKEILIGTSTKAVHTALSKFGIIKSIKMQLVELWQKAVVEFEQSDYANLVTAKWSILIEKDAIGSSLSLFSVWNVLLNAGSSSKIKSILLVSLELNDKFAALEHSLISLTECVDMLAKKWDTPGPMVFQLSSRHQPLVTPSLQNQEADIVMSESSGVVTGDKTVVEVVVFESSVILKMEKTLNNLSITVMSLLAKMYNAGSGDIICWHKEINNLVFIITETKLKDKVYPWIINKFDGICVFTSGVDSGYLGSGIAIIMNNSLVSHVCKVFEVFGQILSVKLLFKNKLSVMILGLYAGVFSVHYNKHTRAKKRPKTSMTTTSKVATQTDSRTLEYYQSIYIHYKQRFDIPKEIETFKKTLYQYIKNRINNYLFGDYNILEVRYNLYESLVHHSHLNTQDFNSQTLETYFQELNFNIIQYCEENYPVEQKFSLGFELETEKRKEKRKQKLRTTPNTPKTTAKHLQTPEQETSFKLPLSITPFLASLAQPQTPNLPFICSIQQQEPILTSTNLINYLAENQSEETKSEQETKDLENEEKMASTYIAKISEFTGEDSETSSQEWLDKVSKAGDANAMEEANRTKLVNLAIGETSSTAEKKIDQLTKKVENYFTNQQQQQQPQQSQQPQRY